jgi:hypothetical protein
VDVNPANDCNPAGLSNPTGSDMSEKYASYQKLQDALQQPGCPICHIGQAAGHKYLDTLLYESVNDPGIRRKLEDSLGFCYYHSRELLTFPGNRLGVGIIEQHMLKTALGQLHQTRTTSRRTLFSKRDERRKREKSPCPACLRAEASEARSIKDLLRYFVDDLDEPLRLAGGLCLTHLQQALLVSDDKDVSAALIRLHEPLWQEQIALLDEFTRKHDYRFRHEGISEAEGAAVERSIDILTGERPL